ncbi:hypothetical protein ID866_6685 [Astraeus odoratus]|nr:hypothetical protein ID866_6685 [Astraeus odoratus]
MPSIRESRYLTFSPRKVAKKSANNTPDDRRHRAAIQYLPIEILSEIFKFTTYSFDDLHDVLDHLTVISHVCRRWRQVSISTSSLWTTIFLCHPLTSLQLSRAATWLSRSSTRPIDIHMDFRDPSWDWDEHNHSFGWQAMETTMRLLIPHAHRWQNVELYTDTWAPMFTFLSYTARIKSAPCLQDIQLARCNAYFAARGESFQPANMALPVAWFGGGLGFSDLHRVSFSGVHVDWAKSGLRGLKVLELKYHAREVMPTVDEFYTVLGACPQLERLTVLGWGPRFDPTQKMALPVAPLLHLEDLALGFIDVDNIMNFLTMISVPNMRSFSIEDVAVTLDPSNTQDASRLLSYLSSVDDGNKRPRFPLSSIRTLTMQGVTLGNAAINPFLSHLSSLEALYLSGMDAPSLHAFLSSISLCPHLATLTLRDIDPAILSNVLADDIAITISLPGLRVFTDLPTIEAGNATAA